MTRLRNSPSDSGSMTVFVAATLATMMLVFAFVVDSHGQFEAISRADSLAAETARAALTAVDTRGPTITIDLDAATLAARTYLRRTGYPGTVVVTGMRTVRVSVTVDQSADIPLPGFLSGYHATGTATAQLVTGTRATGAGTS